MDKIIVEQLAPTGSLRAAINLGNFLLVTDKAQNGDPIGVSPDMASAIAKRNFSMAPLLVIFLMI